MKSAKSIVFVGFVLALAGCNNKMSASNSYGTKTLAATTAEVARKDIVGYVFFDGEVFAPNGSAADVVCPYDVPISEVYVKVGDYVREGAPVAKMELPGVDESLAMAKASYESARNAYQQALSANGAGVAEAEATLKEARAAEAAAKADVLNGGTSDVDAAARDRVAAEQGLAAAKAERDSMVRAERQSLTAAETYWKQARAGSNDGILRAPIGGVVVRLDAKQGVRADARSMIASIVNPAKVQIQGTVPPAHADDVKKGSKILIALEGPNSDPFEGEVTEYSVLPPSEGQASPGYLAVIRFPNRDGKVLPGARVKRLGLRVGAADDALVIPVGAIAKTDDGRQITMVRNGTEWVERSVEIGLSDGALVQIKSGVKEGEVVRVQPQTVAL